MCGATGEKFLTPTSCYADKSPFRPDEWSGHVPVRGGVMLPPDNLVFYSSYNNINDQDIRACQASNHAVFSFII